MEIIKTMALKNEINKTDAIKFLGIPKVTFYRWVKNGYFNLPKPVRKQKNSLRGSPAVKAIFYDKDEIESLKPLAQRMLEERPAKKSNGGASKKLFVDRKLIARYMGIKIKELNRLIATGEIKLPKKKVTDPECIVKTIHGTYRDTYRLEQVMPMIKKYKMQAQKAKWQV